MAVDPGFRAQRVLTFATSLPAQAYRDAASVRGFYTRLLDDLSQVPGVSAAALGVSDRRGFTIEQESPATRELPHSVVPEHVVERYFEAVGIPLKRGRYLGPEDTVASKPVAVINETMAHRFWGAADPIGQRIAWGNEAAHGPRMRIVGVVGDVKQGALNTETISQSYVPWIQVSDRMIADNVVGIMRSLRRPAGRGGSDGTHRYRPYADSGNRSRLTGDVGADDQ